MAFLAESLIGILLIIMGLLHITGYGRSNYNVCKVIVPQV